MLLVVPGSTCTFWGFGFLCVDEVLDALTISLTQILKGVIHGHFYDSLGVFWHGKSVGDVFLFFVRSCDGWVM